MEIKRSKLVSGKSFFEGDSDKILEYNTVDLELKDITALMSAESECTYSKYNCKKFDVTREEKLPVQVHTKGNLLPEHLKEFCKGHRYRRETFEEHLEKKLTKIEIKNTKSNQNEVILSGSFKLENEYYNLINGIEQCMVLFSNGSFVILREPQGTFLTVFKENKSFREKENMETVRQSLQETRKIIANFTEEDFDTDLENWVGYFEYDGEKKVFWYRFRHLSEGYFTKFIIFIDEYLKNIELTKDYYQGDFGYIEDVI